MIGNYVKYVAIDKSFCERYKISYTNTVCMAIIHIILYRHILQVRSYA